MSRSGESSRSAGQSSMANSNWSDSPHRNATEHATKQLIASSLIRAAERNDTDNFTVCLFRSPAHSREPSPAFDINDGEYYPALALALMISAQNDNADMAALILDLGLHADATPPQRCRLARAYTGDMKWAIEEGM